MYGILLSNNLGFKSWLSNESVQMSSDMNLDKPHNLSKPQLENGDNFPYLVWLNEVMHNNSSCKV